MDKIKICVFCNKRPVGKNKEHVIPSWLIKLTGKENRPISVTGIGKTKKVFNFKSFTFPACEKCNNEFSDLEKKTKYVVEKITKRLLLSSSEIEILMDWLDKVRIGIWLGSIMYSENPIGIVPHFGIATRPKKDRLLIISTTDENSLRLNFSGFNDPLFHHLPCFFGIYINGVYFISLSFDCLFYNELPLPNFDRIAETKNGKIAIQLQLPKNSRINLPYIGKRFTVLAQINYFQNLNKNIFDNEQIKMMKDNMFSSKILIIKGNKILVYPENDSIDWKPEKHKTKETLLKESDFKLLRLRNWIAIKALKKSPNPFYKNLYLKLLKSKIINKNY